MSQENPYRKHLSKEDVLHEQCMLRHRTAYPGIPLIHCPSEGERSGFERFKFTVLGGDSGISDLLHPASSGKNKGIWIELKVGSNKLSDDQLKFLIQMHYMGYAAAVVYDRVDDFLFLLQAYYTDPDFFSQGIILSKGELKALKYAEAERTLVPQKRVSTGKAQFKAKMRKVQKAKFGTPIKVKKEKLPNQGKLFNHLKNN